MQLKKLNLWIFKILHLHKGEETKLLLFMGVYFLLSLTIGLMNTGVDAMFLNHFGDADEIPLMLIFGSLSLILVSTLYGSIADRYNNPRLFMLILAIISAFFILLVFLFILQDEVQDFEYKLLYIIRFTLSTFLMLQFWQVCNQYFDVRQGKRLFPLITVGGSIGYVSGSFLIAAIARAVGEWGTLLAIAVSSFLVILLFYRILRFPMITGIRRRKSSPLSEIKEGILNIRDNTFLKIFTFSTLIFGIVSGIILYTYNDIVANLITDTADLTEFLGVWRGLAEILINIVQSTLIMKVMSQSEMGSGFRSGLLMRSIMLVFMLLFFVFSMAASADFSRQLLQALMSPGAVLAFAILPKEVRGRAMAFNNGTISSLGVIIGAVVLVPIIEPFSSTFFGALGMYIVLLIVIIGLIGFRIILNFRINKEYLKTLSSNLKSGNLDLSSISTNLLGITANIQLFNQVLNDFDKLNTSYKLFILNSIQPYIDTETHAKLLYERFDKDEQPQVQAKIIDMLSDLPGDFIDEKLDELIKSKNHMIREEAIYYLVKKGGEKDREEYMEMLSQMLLSEDNEEDVILSIELIERLNLKSMAHLVATKLQSDRIKYIKKSLTALVSMKYEEVIPLLLDRLSKGGNAKLYTEALVNMGSLSVAPVIERYNSLDKGDIKTKYTLITILGRLADINSLGFLLEKFKKLICGKVNNYCQNSKVINQQISLNCSEEEELLIDVIMDAILKFPAETSTPSNDVIMTLVIYEAQKAYEAALNEIEAKQKVNHKGKSVIIKLIEEEKALRIKRLTRSTALITKIGDVLKMLIRALSMVESGSKALRSQAFEILESVGDSNITKYLLPYMENLTFAELSIRMNKYFPYIKPDLDKMFKEWETINPLCHNAKWKQMAAGLILNDSSLH